MGKQEAARECRGCDAQGGHGSVGAHFACLEAHLATARSDATKLALRFDELQRKYDRDTARLREDLHASRRSHEFTLRELAPGRKIA